MELNFEQVNGAYVASVKVDSAYALHLERAGRCPLAVLQRHGEAGQYVPCPLPAVTGSLAPAVVDVALDHCVYPVEVKIVSGLEPHVSTLTPYAGGGGGGGIPDAPQDGVLYGRKDGTWSAVPDPSGDIAVLQGRLDTAEGDIDALQQADTAQDGRLDTAEGEIDALEARMDPIADKVEAMPAAYTLDSSLFHITDESTSEQIRDALEASGGFEAIVEALKRGDALYLHYSGEGWDGTYTESGINLVYGYVIEDDNGTTNLCLYFTRKNNIDVYDIYHDPDDDTYSARNWDYDLSVLDSDEYPLSTLGQKYQQLEASQAQQDEKITALETAQTEQGQRLTAAEGDIAALEGRMDTAEGEIDDLQAADTALDGRLDALETSQGQQDGKITALEAADTALGERLTTAEGKITAAEGEIDALQQADTALDGRLDALETSQGQQDGRLDALEAADTALDGRLTTAEGKITAAEGEIDALQAADTELDGRLDALETSQGEQDGKITALEAADTALGERLTTAEGKITAAEGEIDALQQADAGQDKKITALETADAAHDEAIGSLEQKVEGLEAGGGFPEAPQDGTLYGRKDAAWTAVPDPSGDIAALEGRMDTAEGEIAALETADTALGERLTTAEGKITTAEGDIDDLEGRVAELEEQGGGGGGIPDAPQDGTLYGRRDGAWVPGMDYPSDDSFPNENEVYGRGKNRWVMVQMATNTALFGDFIRDFADIGFAGNYNGSYDGWLPMALYGISAYGLQSPSDQQKLIELYNGCLVFVNRGKYYILMGGCTEDTAELPVAYAVSSNEGEITITGVDVNAFPEAYRFRLVINSSGAITENTITQIQG